MDDSKHSGNAARLVGRLAMVVTCLYATIGMTLQCLKILQTGETPSFGMILLGTLTFMTWATYAILQRPRDMNILVPNLLGVVFSLITLFIMQSAQPLPEIDITETKTVTAESPEMATGNETAN